MKDFKPILLLLIFLIVMVQCDQKQVEQKSFTQRVNPFIGTGGKGHTYPGATVPFGMVQLSPDNGIPGWDRISGYFYEDSTIGSFSHTHLSGTGIGDLYDIPFFPTPYSENTKPELVKFKHEKEFAEPGYYCVTMENGVKAELTATNRVGFHRYTFPNLLKASVYVDLVRAINWDETVVSNIEKISNTQIQGYRFSNGWAPDQRIYFVAEFSRPFNDFNIKSEKLRIPYKKELSENYGAVARFDFDTETHKELLVRVSISSVSITNAKLNLNTELAHWNFDQVRKEAKNQWNQELSKIDAELISDSLTTIFYTALYQSMLAPTTFCDVNGDYYGPDKAIHQAEDFVNYSTFSLWDTFRATHPLFTILQEKRTNDMIKSMLVFYLQNGLLPVWSLQGNETNCMSGYSAVPVIADAVLKDIGDFDRELALEACIASANSDFRGVDDYLKLGYVPYDKEGWSVSKTLEYSFADWGIAQMAKKLGKTDIYDTFSKRAEYYKNHFDESTGFMRGKDSLGNWRTPFSPLDYETDFTESNGWHYFWYTPQAIPELIQKVGGDKAFIKKLDTFFKLDPKPEDDLPIFSTGMIGQYVHGNEPSHHVGYLYNFAGAPWKTQEIARRIMLTQHKNAPDGICGNEDCGQMSAWFIFSALGFYPMNPSSGNYIIGSPLIKQASLNLENGKTFRITAHYNNYENKYVKKVMLNGKILDRSYIKHSEIMAGGKLEYFMSDMPNKEWATEKEYRPIN
ncbi:MAG: GH92 family glycosyl hydrolase [Candidatus Marinimicrobia bacterium]|nr:GH92 family glycosyl hydrolase [Candidatus Neomarinimicrobiota bacterium]